MQAKNANKNMKPGLIFRLHSNKKVSFSSFFFLGITRLPVLEGEVSHVEIPRTSPSLGITIVGGADTPLVSSPFLIKF